MFVLNLCIQSSAKKSLMSKRLKHPNNIGVKTDRRSEANQHNAVYLLKLCQPKVICRIYPFTCSYHAVILNFNHENSRYVKIKIKNVLGERIRACSSEEKLCLSTVCYDEGLD
uniref:Uncharacterized protein n=1 Tax=Micrurus surinamensis TaxID=129470 RepID=A0A2D4PYS5_MICSU